MQENEFVALDTRMVNTRKIIHQIWFNFADMSPNAKDSMVPDKYQKMRQTWLVNNPDWTHILWTDVMGDWLVYKHYPSFWDTYSNYKYPIQRVDAIRFCIMHRYGGIYADMDTECCKSINALVQSFTCSIAFGCGYKLIPFLPDTPSNYFLFSQPRQEFWIDAIEGSNNYGNGKSYTSYFSQIMNAAGPNRVKKTYKRHLDKCQIIDPSYVVAAKEIKLERYHNIAASAFVIHKMYNEWTGDGVAYFYYYGLYILMMIMIITTAIIMSIEGLRRLQYKSCDAQLYQVK